MYFCNYYLWGKMKNLWTRILTAAIAAPIGIALMYFGGIAFIVGILIISIACTYEYLRMFKNIGVMTQQLMAIISNVVLLSVFSFNLLLYGLQFASLTLLFAMIAFNMAIMIFALFRETKHPLSAFPAVISSQLYITFPFLCLIVLRFIHTTQLEFVDANYSFLDDSNAFLFILSVFASIWTNDSMAYFGGSLFGKHPLYPSVSPKKTWEGSICGFLFGTAVFVFFGMRFFNFDLPHLLVLGVLINSISQIGDLFESKLKRHSGIKDSSNLLPGHGGFLDRFDGVLFVMPAVLLYILVMFFLTT